MLSAFKERLAILRLNIRHSYQLETAYFSNNWAGLVSTMLYTATYLLFIDILFANVKTMAGYSRDEMLFLTLVSQIGFFLMATFSMYNADKMIEDVNRGNLDLILIKPLPSLFYVSTRNINLLGLLRDGGIPAVVVSMVIDWQELSFAPLSLICGAIAFVFGLLAADMVKFLLSIPVFWKGEAQEFSSLFYSLIRYDLPWEGLSSVFRLSLAAIIPILIPVSIATSVFLGKSPPLPLTLFAIGMGIVCLLIKSLAWRWALRNYTSASS